MTRAAFAVAALLLLVPALSDAQGSVRAFGDAGLTVFSATKSFEAILGRASGPVFGGGIEFTERNFFLSIGAQRFRKTGHRVFVFQDEVFTLDVDNTITVTPVEVSGGYRFANSNRFIPYAGAGVGWHRFEEKSEQATADEDVSMTKMGFHVLGGIEVPVSSWLAAGVDAQWSTVPNAFGDEVTSVAKLYDEHNLGGFSLRAKIVFGR